MVPGTFSRVVMKKLKLNTKSNKKDKFIYWQQPKQKKKNKNKQTNKQTKTKNQKH